MTYHGFPWRSRFLRGPKIGLELAERNDFTRLGAISTVRLGIKTGDDKFFFLTATGRGTQYRVPVTGLKGWDGNLPRADLLGGLQSPKDLDTAAGRLAAVPARRGRFAGDTYYFAPRANRLDQATRAYISWGELQNVHDKKLVRTNADDSGWFRQTRSRVTSRWALPYNSGYDYGAIDNQIGAVLNGRFIGVEPNEDQDADLLGAILNSTAVTLMRLLEGVATGNEGAFDVGPPAARVMRIPDPDSMSTHGRDSVLRAYAAIADHGHLPPAPDAQGRVSDLRRDLDLAVFTALGMTRGEATVIVDRIYSSYGRWRAAVEAVEDQMQDNRRTLAKRGGSRADSPLQRTVRTVWDEVRTTTALLFDQLLSGEVEIVDPIIATAGDTGQEALFAGSQFPTPDGGVVDLQDTRRADLARRIRDTGYTGPMPLLRDPAQAGSTRDAMIVLETLTKAEVERRANGYVNAELAEEVTAQVMRKWLGASIASLREQLADAADIAINGPDLFHTEGLVPPSENASPD